MSTLEEKITNIEKDLGETKEEIKKAKADGDKEYLMKLMGVYEKQMGYLDDLQKEKNILLEQSKESGNF